MVALLRGAKLTWIFCLLFPVGAIVAMIAEKRARVDSNRQIIDALIEREGGYVHNPADRGGPTKYGITLSGAAKLLL